MDTTAERGHGEARRDLGMKNYSVEKCYSAFFVKGIKVKLFKLQKSLEIVHSVCPHNFISGIQNSKPQKFERACSVVKLTGQDSLGICLQ